MTNLKKRTVLNNLYFVLTVIALSIVGCTTDGNIKKEDTKGSTVDEKSFFDGYNYDIEENYIVESRYVPDSINALDDRYHLELIKVNEEEYFDLPDGVIIDSHIADIFYTINDNSMRALIKQRIIRNDDFIIIEVLSATTNTIISYQLTNLSEVEYDAFKENHYPVDSTIESNSTICFETFNACVQNMNLSFDADPYNAAACDFLPCNTITLTVCLMMDAMGYILESCPQSCSLCDVVYGEL